MEPGPELARQLSAQVADERVLAAIGTVPRDRFVPASLQERAWENSALPIGGGQTISQPLVVARMLELLGLTGTERVLDVGTGSGYHAALLATLAAEVTTIERDRVISAAAAQTLSALGLTGVRCVVGDGWEGWPARAPYDAVNVAACPGPDVPVALAEQLADGGRLVAPIGEHRQRLVVLRRRGDEIEAEALEPVSFVPLVRG